MTRDKPDQLVDFESLVMHVRGKGARGSDPADLVILLWLRIGTNTVLYSRNRRRPLRNAQALQRRDEQKSFRAEMVNEIFVRVNSHHSKVSARATLLPEVPSLQLNTSASDECGPLK